MKEGPGPKASRTQDLIVEAWLHPIRFRVEGLGLKMLYLGSGYGVYRVQGLQVVALAAKELLFGRWQRPKKAKAKATPPSQQRRF